MKKKMTYPSPAELRKHEGKCIGIVDGKVVVSSKSIRKVINVLDKEYPNSKTILSSIPKRDKIFV